MQKGVWKTILDTRPSTIAQVKNTIGSTLHCQGWILQGLFMYALKVEKKRLIFAYSPVPIPEPST
jgi:hypothetical protein